MHDITILDDIILAFDSDLASLAAFGFRTEGDVIVILNHFSAYETTFEVRVNNARRLRSFHTFLECPCPAFLRACGEECLKTKETICGFDKAIDATLFEAKIFEEHLFLFIGFKFGDIGLDTRSYQQDFGLFVFDCFTHSLNILVPIHH